MIANPANDTGFSENPVHGAEAQGRLIAQVLRHCKQRRRAIDAGAHIGLWSMVLAKHFETVVAFEPIPDNFVCLRKNAPTVQHMPTALGATTEWLTPYMPKGGNSGMYWMVPNRDGYRVRSYALDNFGYHDVDLIKIDTEGMEGAVLEGARVTIAESKPTIFFEDNGLGPQHYGSAWIDPRPILQSLGYKQLVRIAKNELWLP